MTKPIQRNFALSFNKTKFRITKRSGQVWLRGAQIALALGYQNPENAAKDIFKRHAQEFTDNMTAVVKIKTKGGEQETRIFSLRGAHLLGMFARTEKAAAFRRWILDVLDNEIERAPKALPSPPRALPGKRYHYPRTMLEQPHFTSPRTGKVTLRLSMLANTTQFVSPLFALLNQLRSEGHDISGAFDEAVALRTAAQQSNQVFEQIGALAMEGRLMAAETTTPGEKS